MTGDEAGVSGGLPPPLDRVSGRYVAERELEVLVYLHARLPPVVHRDITPRNMMLRGDRLFLIDFGAVRLAFTESTTMT